MLNIPTLFELLAIFSSLEFDLKFTFTISVTGAGVDDVNVGYACITTEICVDQKGVSESEGVLANYKHYYI